jgi:hypothetical protein
VPPNDNNETVSDILKRKQGRIKNAPLPPGSPSWDEILDLTWEEIKERAIQRTKGFKTFRKLLSDPEYDK